MGRFIYAYMHMYPLVQKIAMRHADRKQTSPVRRAGRRVRRMFQSKTVAPLLHAGVLSRETWVVRTVEFMIPAAQVRACIREATVFQMKHNVPTTGAAPLAMFAYDRRQNRRKFARQVNRKPNTFI